MSRVRENEHHLSFRTMKICGVLCAMKTYAWSSALGTQLSVKIPTTVVE